MPWNKIMKSGYNPRTTPWEISEDDFRSLATPYDRMKFLLRYAILAPSGHNTQPWTFQIQPEGVLACADLSRRLPVVDPGDRELIISVGAAIMNFRIAAAHFGYSCEVEPLIEEIEEVRGDEQIEPLALLKSERSDRPDPLLDELFPAIVQRRTNRNAYLAEPLANSELEHLQEVSVEEKAEIRIITDEKVKSQISDLVFEGDRIQMSNPLFREELARWIRPNSTRRGDGITGDGFGIPGPVSWLGPIFMRRVDLGKSQAKKDRRLVQGAPALAVVLSRGSDEDRPQSLLESGQILERFVLWATKMGLQHSYFNQPVEVPTLRHALKAILDTEDQPQILFRFGHAAPVKRAMPRRPIDSVVRQ